MPMPKLPAGQKRTEAIYVLLRPAEKVQLETAAGMAGLSRGSYFRQLFLEEQKRERARVSRSFVRR